MPHKVTHIPRYTGGESHHSPQLELAASVRHHPSFHDIGGLPLRALAEVTPLPIRIPPLRIVVDNTVLTEYIKGNGPE
jgi:hypothetical protein